MKLDSKKFLKPVELVKVSFARTFTYKVYTRKIEDVLIIRVHGASVTLLTFMNDTVFRIRLIRDVVL